MNELPRSPSALATALAVIGDRWSLLIIQELVLGGQRFSDIMASLRGISAKVLSAKLSSLEQHGLIERSSLPGTPNRYTYSLTPKGSDLIPAMEALASWGERYGGPPFRSDSYDVI